MMASKPRSWVTRGSVDRHLSPRVRWNDGRTWTMGHTSMYYGSVCFLSVLLVCYLYYQSVFCRIAVEVPNRKEITKYLMNFCLTLTAALPNHPSHHCPTSNLSRNIPPLPLFRPRTTTTATTNISRLLTRKKITTSLSIFPISLPLLSSRSSSISCHHGECVERPPLGRHNPHPIHPILLVVSSVSVLTPS